MARNQTLGELLQDFRAEIRASGNAAHNTSTRESHVRLLQRTQLTLWEGFDWPHMRVERYDVLQAGQRLYDPPTDIHIDRLETIDVRDGDTWVRLCVGITPQHHTVYDPRRDERSWPVSHWQQYENDQIEVWPLPSDNGVALEDGEIRFTGIRNLSPLVDDEDTADLDGTLIVLYAAAEQLAASGAKDAAIKLRAAEMRRNVLIGNASKKKSFSLSVNMTEPRFQARIPTVHYRDRETG